MKIGDKVKILQSNAGRDESYSDGDEYTVDEKNFDRLNAQVKCGFATVVESVASPNPEPIQEPFVQQSMPRQRGRRQSQTDKS